MIGSRRRTAASVACAAVLAAAAVSAAPAAADQTIVSSTVYPSSSGSVTHPSAGLQALGSCPQYSGSSPFYLWPGDAAYQPASGSSWALSTVLTCGLGLTLSDVNSIQVLNPGLGFEAPLSSADLTDPGQFHDPSAPNALPVVSVNGGSGQTTYTRPWRGGSDDNARDQVTTTGGAPISIVVYVGGAPLQVRATWTKVSATTTTMTAALSTTVATAAGAPVAASALSFSWSFGDNTSSTAATPTHAFPAGVSYVTVQVTDAADGSGGTATLTVPATTATPTSGAHSHTGGSHRTHSRQPAGSNRGTHNGSSSGRHGSGGSTQKTGATNSGGASPQTATTTTQTTTTTGTTTTSTTSTSSQPAHPPRARRAAPARHKRQPPAVTQGPGKLVAGRLLGNLDAVPASASPLVQVIPAVATPAAVRQATTGSSAPVVAGVLVVLLLFGAGAWRELRWRHAARLDG